MGTWVRRSRNKLARFGQPRAARRFIRRSDAHSFRYSAGAARRLVTRRACPCGARAGSKFVATARSTMITGCARNSIHADGAGLCAARLPNTALLLPCAIVATLPGSHRSTPLIRNGRLT